MARYIPFPSMSFVMQVNDDPGDPPGVPPLALINRSTGTYWVVNTEPGYEPEALVCPIERVSDPDGKIARFMQVQTSFVLGQEVDYGSLN